VLRRSFALRRPGLPRILLIGPKLRRSFGTWKRSVRGEIFSLKAPRNRRGREQAGARLAVVLQSDLLPLSTWLVAPTSTSALPASFRPEIDVHGRPTRVLVEQTTAIDPERLGPSLGFLAAEELRQVDAALRLVLAL
jgi:mRNA interferase MazF